MILPQSTAPPSHYPPGIEYPRKRDIWAEPLSVFAKIGGLRGYLLTQCSVKHVVFFEVGDIFL